MKRVNLKNSAIALTIGLVMASCGGKGSNQRSGTEISEEVKVETKASESEKVEEITTLVVKEVVVDIGNSSFKVKALKMIDKKGNRVSFSAEINKWFENATIEDIIFPKGTQVTAAKDGDNIYMIIANDGKLLFKFKVNDKIYPISIGTGTEFVVKKNTDGKYILLPEEMEKSK